MSSEDDDVEQFIKELKEQEEADQAWLESKIKSLKTDPLVIKIKEMIAEESLKLKD